jgi:hypothetical protein
MRLSHARYLGQAALIVCTSCSGHTVDGGWNDEGATPDDASISSAKCSVSDSSLVSVTNATTFTSLLAGRWYRCGNADPSIGFAPAALELTSDLSWTILVANASGAYVPGTAPGESGQFKIDEVLSDCCPSAQALSFDGNVHVDVAAFGSSPTRMSWAYDQDGQVEERIVGAR